MESPEESVPMPVVEEKKPEVKLVDVVVMDENVALNVIVSFLTLAQRRGAFTLEESSKIWECVKKFQKNPL